MSNLSQYVPGYVVKSDFLPTRVIEGSNSQTNELVCVWLIVVEKI